MAGESILVVDDDRTTAKLMQSQLQNLGYRLTALVSRGSQAVECAREMQPDLVLMDIDLGNMPDGIEAADDIQNELRIPVIYVTAHADSETLARAKRTRPLGYINKPLRENDLRTTLELALEDMHGSDGTLQLTDQVLSMALNKISTGVVLLDQNLKVSFVNQIAHDILSGDSLLYLRDGMIGCHSTGKARKLQKLVASDDGGTLLITRAASPQPLQILVTPLDKQLDQQNRSLPTAIVFLFDPITNLDCMVEMLRNIYRLTGAEARLAAALVQDPRLEQAAATVHISISTARTHLKRIFNKTGTNRQSTLVHRIVTGPAGLLLRTSQISVSRHD